MVIDDNQVMGNNDGVVLVNSKGIVRNNSIKENLRSGVLTAGETFAVVENNEIEENQMCGVLIKESSLPILRKNTISKNYLQVQMDRHAKPKWVQYQKENPKILGNS